MKLRSLQPSRLDTDGALLSLPSFPNSQPVIKYESNDVFSQLLAVKAKGLPGQSVVSMDFEGSQAGHEKGRGEQLDPRILLGT